MVDCLENTRNAFPLAPLPGGPLHLPLTLSLAVRPDWADRTAADTATHEPSQQDHRWGQRVEFQLLVRDANCRRIWTHRPPERRCVAGDQAETSSSRPRASPCSFADQHSPPHLAFHPLHFPFPHLRRLPSCLKKFPEGVVCLWAFVSVRAS